MPSPERRVFQINLSGELVKVYPSITVCADENKVSKVYVYKVINDQKKFKHRYYLTHSLTERLAKRSYDKVPKNFSNVKIMVDYANHLKQYFYDYGLVLSKKQKVKIKRELSKIRYYIKNP